MKRKSKISLAILVIVVLSFVLIAYMAISSQNPQNAMKTAIENCEKSYATTGTYTFTTTEVSGVNITITITSTTTQVQVCT
ncbi:MAG: hypothetical protein M1587_05350 [Thaumarchaeota archaeon]|nr:hypothetical protein [Nitrososphaerota archaeon]MDG6908210.1 hypothetical protein [Nitrososphaerota archaeon]